MFTGSNLMFAVKRKVVRGDTKMSAGRVSPGMLQMGVTE